jgi:23S rRNA pseudouridine2605 synthase
MPTSRTTNRQPQRQRPPRLQKVLALAGYGSRRACEQLILDGRVEVDRQVVIELGTRVDARKQHVRVDGEAIQLPQPLYYALNKPTGVVTTNRDPAGRMRVIDLIPGGDQLFAIGRLDKSSSGLILVTNDGDFANNLAHPRYGIQKTYRVVVAGHPTHETLDKLRRGVRLSDGRVQVGSLRIKSRSKHQTVLQMVLEEGRNREIRRMLAAVGHKVISLQRTAIGSLRLGDLPEGAHRPLTQQEVRRLRSAAQAGGRGRRRPSSGRRRDVAETSATATRGLRRRGAGRGKARASRSDSRAPSSRS